jgi:hypothetical protein
MDGKGELLSSFTHNGDESPPSKPSMVGVVKHANLFALDAGFASDIAKLRRGGVVGSICRLLHGVGACFHGSPQRRAWALFGISSSGEVVGMTCERSIVPNIMQFPMNNLLRFMAIVTGNLLCRGAYIPVSQAYTC